MELELKSARHQIAWLSRQLFGQKADRVSMDQVHAEWTKFCKELETQISGTPTPAGQDVSTVSTSMQILLALVDKAGQGAAALLDSETATSLPDVAGGEAVESERAVPDSAEQPQTETTGETAPPTPDDNGGRSRKGHGRRRLPETLPTRYIVLEPDEIPEGAKRIGEKVSERLGIIPRHLEKIVIVRPVYAISENTDGEERTKTFKADRPSEMIPGGLFTPTGLGHVIAERFAWHTPWNRLSRKFAEGGFYLPKSTLSGVSIRAEPAARRVIDAMLKHAKGIAPAMHIDPTSVRFLERNACKKGAAWIRVALDVGVFVDFSRNLDGATAAPLLAGWRCPMVADGAQIFDHGVKQYQLERGGCWNHGRRKLVYVSPMDPRALAGIQPISELFKIEAEIADLDPDQKLEIRKQRSAPIVKKIFEWRDRMLKDPSLPSRGEFAKALRYLRNQEARLTLFLRDGRVLIHNNLAELGCRHIAVGRLNWTFLGSDAGAGAASVWLTLILSAAMWNLAPEGYLRDLFRVLPDWPQTRVLELAPHAWKATRARLIPGELMAEYGPLTIPERPGALPDIAQY